MRPGFVGVGRSFWSREHPEIPALRQETQPDLVVEGDGFRCIQVSAEYCGDMWKLDMKLVDLNSMTT